MSDGKEVKPYSVDLSEGYSCIIDAEDIDKIKPIKWRAGFFGKKIKRIYAVGNLKGKTVLMHRYVLGVDEHETEVDHINGNKLDNRKSNLRACTRSQNMMNQGPRLDSATGLKGVWFNKARNKYHSQITANGKRIHLGFFKTANEAAKAYDLKAIELHGEFAYLNFPENFAAIERAEGEKKT